MANVKCPICGEIFNRDKIENVHLGNRYFHKDCLSEDDIYRDKIFQFLKSVWGQYTYIKINNQIKNYCLTLKCRVKNIYEDMMYFFDVKKNDFQTYKNTLGIIPFIHEEAQKYYANITRKEIEKEKIALQLEEQINKDFEIIHISKELKQRKKRIFEIEER